MAITTTQIQTKMPKPKGALRTGKYYVKAINGQCANCARGPEGCCQPNLRFAKDDFRLDFTNVEEVFALLETNVISISVEVRPHEDRRDMVYRVSLHIKGNASPKRRYASHCVFWYDKGCRLRHNVRPHICRTHTCYDLSRKSTREVNTRDKGRSLRRNAYGWYSDVWSAEEIIAIVKAIGMSKKNTTRLTHTQYKKLDWDYILTVLQGSP